MNINIIIDISSDVIFFSILSNQMPTNISLHNIEF